jgi:hypothetical protein
LGAIELSLYNVTFDINVTYDTFFVKAIFPASAVLQVIRDSGLPYGCSAKINNADRAGIEVDILKVLLHPHECA